MSASIELDGFYTKGWVSAEFELAEKERAEYAKAANAVISLALEDEKIKQALKFDINPGLNSRSARTGQFGIGYPRNSVDRRVYLHTGYQTRQAADAQIPERNQPAILRNLWEPNEAMLQAIEANSCLVLTAIGAASLEQVVFPKDIASRGIHLRTVRYSGALNEPVGYEVVSGHADLGLMTWHLYETHGGWLRGAPYPRNIMSDEDTPERREAVRQIRGSMQLLEQTDDTLPFFLGANWHSFSDVPNALRDLPACYHAGFRPDPNSEEISIYADQVNEDVNDRVSVVSFMHPNIGTILNGKYVPASVSECRPEY